jgi:hypothetical protein
MKGSLRGRAGFGDGGVHFKKVAKHITLSVTVGSKKYGTGPRVPSVREGHAL